MAKKKSLKKKKLPPKKKAAHKKKTKKQPKKAGWLWRLFKWCFVCGVWAFLALVGVILYYAHDLPDIRYVKAPPSSSYVKLLAHDGTEIARFGALQLEQITYGDLPVELVQAVTVVEDRRFFRHFGLDLIGLARAFYVNIHAGRVKQGGSTITQQLAKVSFLTHERNLKRKIQEAILALYLEHKYSKEEILANYLNTIYLGSGHYGVAAASRAYFGKDVSDLTLYESATIAGLIKAPSRYSPINNPEISAIRTKQVLQLMVDRNYIATEKVLSADLIPSLKKARGNKKWQYPYFSSWIKEQLPDYVGNDFSYIEVRTSLDKYIQDNVKTILQKHLDKQKDKALQAAVIVMSPDGEILAMTGGRSFAESQFNRATQAYRQPGSAFKLFVYLAALAEGYQPLDILVDEPIKYGKWQPKNYGRSYKGAVPLQEAFAESINTVAVKLAKEVGMRKITALAEKLGVVSPIKQNLSSSLGSSEVSLMEMTTAYAHLANFGQTVWAHGIKQIKDDKQTILYQRKSHQPEQVLPADQTAFMNQMLMQVVETGTGKNAHLANRDVAGKTGTSQDKRDAWFIGFTADYVIGVWVGKDDNSSAATTGGGIPARIFKDIAIKASDGLKARPIATTEYGVRTRGKTVRSFWDALRDQLQ